MKASWPIYAILADAEVRQMMIAAIVMVDHHADSEFIYDELVGPVAGVKG